MLPFNPTDPVKRAETASLGIEHFVHARFSPLLATKIPSSQSGSDRGRHPRDRRSRGNHLPPTEFKQSDWTDQGIPPPLPFGQSPQTL